jgi:hypothetical protein
MAQSKPIIIPVRRARRKANIVFIYNYLAELVPVGREL